MTRPFRQVVASPEVGNNTLAVLYGGPDKRPGDFERK
jgi:hypothetical protein